VHQRNGLHLVRVRLQGHYMRHYLRQEGRILQERLQLLLWAVQQEGLHLSAALVAAQPLLAVPVACAALAGCKCA